MKSTVTAWEMPVAAGGNGVRASQETVHGKWRGVEIVELLRRARRARDRGGNIGQVEEGWQWCEPAAQTREARIERRRRVEAHLHRKLEAARTNIANLDTAISQKLMLYAQRPGDDLGRNAIRYQARSGCACLNLVRRRNVGLKEAATRKKALSGIRYSR